MSPLPPSTSVQISAPVVDPFSRLLASIDRQSDQIDIPDIEHWLRQCEKMNIKILDKKNEKNLTLLGHVVVSQAPSAVLRFLLTRTKIDVNFREQSFNHQQVKVEMIPLLHLAAYTGNSEAVTLLCASPIINLCAVTERTGLSALHMSIKGGHPDIVHHMLQRAQEKELFSTFLNQRDKLGMAALHHAAWEGHKDIVALLLHYRDNIFVNAETKNRFTPLHLASWNNRLAVVHMLLADPKVELLVPAGQLRWLVGELEVEDKRETGLQKRLIKQEANFPGSEQRRRSFTLEGHTHLWIGDFRRQLRETAATNLLSVISPDLSNERVTALHCAAFAGHAEVVAALVGATAATGAQARKALNAVDDHDMSPLHYAVIGGDVATVEELAKNERVRGNQEESHGNLTALDVASVLVRRGKSMEPGFLRKYHLIRNYKAIMSALCERRDVTQYLGTLYNDRQVYVNVANAILIGAALVAGWLQPPLGYHPYYATQFLETGGAPPETYDDYAAVGQYMSVQVFWIFNSFSFFSAVATVLSGIGAVLPSEEIIGKGEVSHVRRLLVRTSLVFSASVLFVLGAFVAAGFASLPPVLKYEWGMIMTAAVGTSSCFVVFLSYFRRLSRLFRFGDVKGGFKAKIAHAFDESFSRISKEF